MDERKNRNHKQQKRESQSSRDALRESKERLDLAFEAAKLGTFLAFPLEGRSEPDARTRALFGLPEDEMSDSIEEFTKTIHPGDRQRYTKALAKSINPDGDGWLNVEIRIVHPDGSLHWVALAGRTVFEGEPRQPVRMYGTVADITERKDVEQRQAFLLKLSDALRPLADPLAIQETAARLLGEELGADRVMYVEIAHADGASEYVIERNYLASPETVPVIGRYTAADFGLSLIEEGQSGHTMVVDNIKNDPRLAQGEREAFLGIGIQAYITTPLIKEGKWVASVTLHQVEPRTWRAVDVSLVEEVAERTWAAVEWARAEEALHASGERLRLIIETAKGYAIFTTDARGFINSWNAGAAHIFGWTEMEILGQNSEVLFTPEDRARGEAQKELETARTEGIAPDIRWHLRKDGSRVFIQGEVRPLRDGQLHGFVKIGRDLTAQRETEEALHENQKQLQVLNETLEQQVQEKTAEVRQVASELIKATQKERLRISHLLHDDLQQNIYAIQMQMTFLKNMLEDGQEAARNEAEDIASQLSEILEMTRQLSIDLSPPILHGEGLWHAIHWLAGRMQKRYGLPIELRAEGSFVVRDKELHVLLFNCVREMLFNIVKHANASSAVVQLERLDDNRLHIEVSDNGTGFTPDRSEPPHSEDQALPRSLGLVTIRHQLSLFGGTMEIHSRPGAGTQVDITVPIHKEG